MLIDPRPKKFDKSRRSLLKALGTTALSYPFFRLLESSVCEAAGDDPPLRLLVIATPHGCPYEFWRPRAPGSDVPGSGTTTSFDIDFPESVLAPLSAYKDRINILDGIDYVAAARTARSGHQGYGSILTGEPQPDQTTFPTGPSLDQFLAQHPMVGGQTAFRSLEISVGGNKYPERVLSWGPNGTILPRLLNPYQTFQRVFASYVPPQPGDSMSPPVGPDPALVAKNARRQGVLRYVQSDLKRMQARLGPLEKHKLDQHLQAVVDMERRLTGAGSGGMTATPTASCSPLTSLPDAPTWQGLFAENPNNSVNFPSAKYGTFMFDHVQQWSDLQVQMITQAFACDLTRVVTLQYFEAGSDGLAPWALPDVSPSDPLADPHVNGHQYNYGAGDAVALRLATYKRWFSQQVAKLMDQLDAIPEGNGSVLDHTLIWWTNELGSPGTHLYNNVPMVLSGGAKGVFQTGRYLSYSKEIVGCETADNYDCMTPHNKLLVSIANAFPGVDLNSYGNTTTYDWGSGALPLL